MSKKRLSKSNSRPKFSRKGRSFLIRHNNVRYEFKPENALMHFARLEGIDRPIRPRKYENKNLTIDNPPKKMYTFQNVFDNSICQKRKERRREIMRKTRGFGLRVKFARWLPSSYVYCR